MLERNIAATVIAKGTVNEKPTAPGDIVLVDECTFRNLVKKGRLKEASPEEAAKAKAAATEAAEDEEEAAETPKETKAPAPKTRTAKA